MNQQRAQHEQAIRDNAARRARLGRPALNNVTGAVDLTNALMHGAVAAGNLEGILQGTQGTLTAATTSQIERVRKLLGNLVYEALERIYRLNDPRSSA